MFKAVTLRHLSDTFGTFVSTSLKNGTISRRFFPVLYQSATITSKQFRDRSVKKPAPWPYKEKKYTYFHSFFGLDSTLSRFDENTQLIVVEGNIGSGKTEFAKKLADELEMLYFPEPSVDSLYIDEQGFDLRKLDHLMPENFKSCDLRKFYEDPKGLNVGVFQMYMYILRLEQYMEALAHILNTGQGVVLERCVFSDTVFVETMCKLGYFSPQYKTYYYTIRTNTLDQVCLKPTLVIYLDTDVDTILGRIKKRNIDYEINSKVLSKEYLSTLEHFYKQDYLKYIDRYSELLVYDWSQYGDIDAVVDDIEKVNFDKYYKYDFKLSEWRKDDRDTWEKARIFYTNQRSYNLSNLMIPCFDVPELEAATNDLVKMTDVINKVASFHYEKGYNPYFGDKGILFKTKRTNYWDLQKYKIFQGLRP